MEELVGKVAVVTGAASGIGLALARRFAAEGMVVALADIEEAPLEEAAASIASSGATALAVPTDVSQVSQVEALRDAVLDRFGAVHVVCNNAGVGGVGPPWDLATWRWVVGVNLWGVVHGVHAFLPVLTSQGEGHIVNTASAAGVITSPVGPAYVATKHAVVGLSERLYLDVHPQGIGVSVLCPGIVATRIVESDRNWPPELGPNPAGALREHHEALLEAFRSHLLSDGMDPGEVADRVLDAIVEDRFWIFTHPETVGMATERMRRAAEGLPPTL